MINSSLLRAEFLRDGRTHHGLRESAPGHIAQPAPRKGRGVGRDEHVIEPGELAAHATLARSVPPFDPIDRTPAMDVDRGRGAGGDQLAERALRSDRIGQQPGIEVRDEVLHGLLGA